MMEEAVRRGDLEAVNEFIQVVESDDSEWKRDISLLFVAIEKGYEDVAEALLGAQTLSWEELWTAHGVASANGLEELVQKLFDEILHSIRAGTDCTGLSQAQKNDLFRHASRKGDWEAITSLLRSGCCVSILSKEEQEKLLLSAFDALGQFMGDISVVQALLHNLDVNILSRRQQEGLLVCACFNGDLIVCDILITNGCNVNCTHNLNGWPYRPNVCTPLIAAAQAGHEEVIKKLILAGAKVGMKYVYGNTALHHAAASNNIQCGVLLAEAGASMRTKNWDSLTPLDVARSAEFVGAIKQAASFTSRKTICIIGNAGSGKSTLIAALQAKKSSFFGRMYNYFFGRVDDVQRTAGIESIHHCNQEYGEALFFDFAGQLEYHGPHQVFLESLLSNRGVSMTLLLVVKATQEEEAIRHQLHCWLTPVALMANAANPAQVIVIGSFLDQVTSKEEAAVKLATCVEATRKDLQEQLPLQIVGSCLLNCRQPQSEGMDQLCRYLEAMSVPEFRAAHTQYSLAWVLSQIRSCFKDQAIQLQRFAKWIQEERNLPQTMPPPEEVCQDLAAAGHVIYLPNKEAPPMSWLVLDLPGILRDLYGTLFSQNVVVHNEFGLLRNTQLKALFPDLGEKFVQQLLVCLEFCIPVDPSLLKVEKLIQEENTSGWLFFPALISANPPQPRSEGVRQENLSAQCLCWQLKTSKKHYISARVLQTILLRLAAHFVVLQHNEDDVCHHSCNIWLNGIAWWTNCGIDVTIHITNNRVIKVVAAGGTKTSADKLFHYLSNVISDILITVKFLSPNLFAAAYIVHPPIMAALHEDVTTPTPMEMFLVEGIRNTIATNNTYALSLKDPAGQPTRLPVSDLFGGWSPSLKDIKRILWTQPEPDQSQSPVESSNALSPASINPSPAPTAVSADPTDPPLDRPLASTVAANVPPLAPTVAANDQPLAPTVAANDCSLAPTVAANDPSLAPTVAANDPSLAPTVAANNPSLAPTVAANNPSLAPTVAANDQPLAPTVAANDCSLAPTVAANYQPLAPTVAANDCPLAPIVAANDPSLAPTVAANDPSLAPTVAANDPPLASTVAANDPSLAPSVAANDPSLAPTVAANDQPLAPTVAANDCPLAPTSSLVDTQPTPNPALKPSLSIPSGAQALLDTSAVPTLDDVNELIVTQVAAKWHNLAIKLGVKDFIIDIISEDHPKSCVAACQDMFKRWLREERHTGGEERTWSTLLTALGRADFRELERSLQRKHFHNE